MVTVYERRGPPIAFYIASDVTTRPNGAGPPLRCVCRELTDCSTWLAALAISRRLAPGGLAGGFNSSQPVFERPIIIIANALSSASAIVPIEGLIPANTIASQQCTDVYCDPASE
ncbi:hypothetical protein JMUB5695_01222 [Mycobacterium heckeshornense]|uniref:Uncharacterized protein n=1 Tax=Mycobacterium heckeshornense TaxID=110505 RepID=A0A7R7YQP0_9MYCO|nr:hypothetical protein MHEC_10760 [Mycobacterium heckeshornense]BCQ07799.1 hypothetical protein JMUB5695_01222 [Mycobacterium heckeshornense]